MKKHKEYWDILKMLFFVIGITLLFYRNILWMLLIGIPLGILGFRRLKGKWETDRKWEINLEFKEGLQGIAAALSAGYSIENALMESRKDLRLLYGTDSVLEKEFEIMQEQLHLNQPVERVFDEFAARSGVEDVERFAEIFRTAKRSGGDLVAITRTSAERIGEKIEIRREIHTMISGKQMEGRIMNIVPLGMIAYFWFCSPGFLDVFYQGMSGHLMMTFFLFLYLTAYRMSERIIENCLSAA